MELKDLTGQPGEWLRGTGPESDVIISTRIRLARNLVEFPFLTHATDHQKKMIVRMSSKWVAVAPPYIIEPEEIDDMVARLGQAIVEELGILKS